MTQRRRAPGVRTAKITLAAVLSFVLADRLHTSDAPLLAPLTALLVVQLTLYETVTSGVGRIASVVLGVVLSVGIAASVGLTWWSVGGVVAASLVVGQLLGLGSHLMEMPITAMIVLSAVGTSDSADRVAAGRVYETLIGAAVGLAVNAALAPPLYMQPAGEALGDLSDAMASYLRGLAAELRRGWSRTAADHWLHEARSLGKQVEQADRALAVAEKSTQLNPRGPRARTAQPRLRTGLTGLEHAYVSLRSMSRAMLDRTYFVPEEEAATGAYSAEVLAALADVLVIAADALDDVGTVASTVDTGDTSDTPGLAAARFAVGEQLGDLQERRDELARLLVVHPQHDEATWQQHGALLAAVDRLRIEVEASVRPSREAWRAHLVSDRQRSALHRMTRTGLRRGRPPKP